MSTSASHEFLFSSLPRTRTPWTEFAFGTGMQAAAVAGVLWVRLLYPAVVTAPQHSFNSIQLVSTPVPVNHDPQPQLPPPVVVEHVEATLAPIRPAALKQKLIAKAVEEEAPVPSLSVTPRKPDLPLTPAPVIPQEAVKTNVFSTGSSATPTIARAPAQVQTGGFGDPNGLPAKSNQVKPVTVAAMGSFDLPSGPAYGNGTGGSKGTPAVVTSSGFGNGTAIADDRVHIQAAVVQRGGFGDADVLAPPTTHSQVSQAAIIHAVPAEILSKPTPTYTTEARNLRIEGEVLLEVTLQASGNLRVLRVVQGLGHGLDDNAVKAAEQIHFKPAMRNGQPADSTVVLHIIFQLA
ncbi:MAG: energy transducer TonB [Candidatus Sulfotelmatobacter sp.]